MTKKLLTGLLPRRLIPAEWPRAFPIVAQLRGLDEDEFIRRVQRQTYSGYELVGAFLDVELLGVMGMRPVHTLARGAHLHVDDLVVDDASRGSGAGRALIDFAEADARARGMTAVFLDAVQEAVPFYERLCFVFHPARLMRKSLG